jgi:glutamate-1-semialdehyde aminotransferase
MRGMEEIFFSTTFGGETLALAAARAVLAKLEAEPVLETIAARGAALREGTRAAVARAGLADVVQVSGHPAWSFVQFATAGAYDPLAVKTLFLQECLARGVLTLGTHNVCYALTDDDVAVVLAAYGEVFPILRAAIDAGDLHARLRCAPLQPLFQVRR